MTSIVFQGQSYFDFFCDLGRLPFTKTFRKFPVEDFHRKERVPFEHKSHSFAGPSLLLPRVSRENSKWRLRC